MARRRRRNPQEQLEFGRVGPKKAALRAAEAMADDYPWIGGQFHGPYARESMVTFGRRAPGRGKARVYGPVQSPAMYKAKRRKPKTKPRAKARKRRGRTVQQLQAWSRKMAAARRAHARRRSGARKHGHGRGRRATKAQLRAHRQMISRRRAASKRSKKHLRARTTIRPGQMVAGRVRRNPHRGAGAMSRRRTLVNPHHRRRRRHNPAGMAGAVRSISSAAIPGVVAGLGAGLLDSAVLGGQSMLIRIGAKVALAGAGGLLLRSNPVRAAAFIGGMLSTAAYEGGVKAAGGLVAHNKPAGMKELAGMAAEDEASLGLLQTELRGLGLLEEDHGLGDFEPDLGDLEPNLGDEEMEGIAYEDD